MRFATIQAIVVGLAVSQGVAASDSGPQLDYLLHCSGCHGADRAGVPERGVPPLQADMVRFLKSDAGRAFLVQVPGVSQSGLGDAQVTAVLNWLLGEGIGSRRYSAAEVRQLRQRRLVDVMAARAKIVGDLGISDPPRATGTSGQR